MIFAIEAKDIVSTKLDLLRADWVSDDMLPYFERIKLMCFKEVDHIKYMKKYEFLTQNEFAQQLSKKFNRKEIWDSYYKVSTEEDIANLALSNVSLQFTKVFESEKISL